MGFFPKGWGEYPPEYNREIHGPYNPSMYYGKRDTPFGDVKLGELLNWFGRRKKTPRAVAGAISRAWFKYQMDWVSTKKPGPAFLYHLVFGVSLFFFLLDYKRYAIERRYRFH